MKLLRYLSVANSRTMMPLVLMAFAMQALVPAGLMVAPAAGGGVQIILCPHTHPLARAAAAKATDEMAAMHAAMGHGSMDHAAMGHGSVDHAAMGHGSVDHAAMGHGPASPDDPAPAFSAGQSCAFAGAGALAVLPPGRGEPFAALTTELVLPPLPLQPPRRVETRLRPPLRAPPTLI